MLLNSVSTLGPVLGGGLIPRWGRTVTSVTLSGIHSYDPAHSHQNLIPTQARLVLIISVNAQHQLNRISTPPHPNTQSWSLLQPQPNWTPSTALFPDPSILQLNPIP